MYLSNTTTFLGISLEADASKRDVYTILYVLLAAVSFLFVAHYGDPVTHFNVAQVNVIYLLGIPALIFAVSAVRFSDTVMRRLGALMAACSGSLLHFVIQIWML